MKSQVFFILFLVFCLQAHSQFSNYTFGNVTKEELLMKDCSFEPSALAMILAEKCEVLNEIGAPYHVVKVKRRIKVLTKEGLSYGNFELDYLSRFTEITFFSASVYNLESDKIVESKVKSDAIIITKIDKNRTKYAVSFPNVKVGSVIDIFYKQNNDNLIPIQPWYFQSEIPCGWSEYIPKIQKKASYTYYYTNVLPFAINTIQNPTQGSELKGGYLINRFAIENAPSYHLNEPFVERIEDQLSKVELVFKSYNENSIWGNGVNTLSWSTIQENLLDNQNLGKVTRRGKFLHDPLKNIVANSANYEDSLRKVYEFIRQQVKCNGYRNIYANDIKETFTKKTGNTGEINLLLIAALREIGFDAHPLLLTTSEEAPLCKTDPRNSDVNFLVAAVFGDNSYYLLNASNREIAFNSLSLKCLNGDGFLISDHNHNDWIPLMRNEHFETQTTISYSWDPEKANTIFVEKQSYSLSANKLRYFISANGEAEYVKERKQNYQKYDISTPQCTGLSNTDEPVVEKFSFTPKLSDYNSSEGYYLQSIPFDHFEENPFDALRRDFRIDFLAPTIQDILVNISIPAGYKVVSEPEMLNINKMHDDLLFRFDISISDDNRQISLHSRYEIKESSFSKDHYNDLRQFFAEIVKMQNSVIELKKE